jgi:hypothetical protein
MSMSLEQTSASSTLLTVITKIPAKKQQIGSLKECCGSAESPPKCNKNKEDFLKF